MVLERVMGWLLLRGEMLGVDKPPKVNAGEAGGPTWLLPPSSHPLWHGGDHDRQWSAAMRWLLLHLINEVAAK